MTPNVGEGYLRERVGPNASYYCRDGNYCMQATELLN